MPASLRRGVAKLVKAPDFDSGMRGFESFLPCQNSFLSKFSTHRWHMAAFDAVLGSSCKFNRPIS